MKLNYGCGETKLEGCINIDCESSTNPDIITDIRKAPLPFKDEEIEEIYCIHNIEHIELKYWDALFEEFWRILIPEGQLVLAYPEFEICVKYYLENKRGLRGFWRATLFGRQLYNGDYHVTPVTTYDILNYLHRVGFDNIAYGQEGNSEYYTLLTCNKVIKPLNKAEMTQKMIFGEKVIYKQDRFIKK